VVTDLVLAGLSVAEAEAVRPDDPPSLPPHFPAPLKEVFPWKEVMVFRAGRYTVHRVTQPAQRLP
jgi:hypothetical protein